MPSIDRTTPPVLLVALIGALVSLAGCGGDEKKEGPSVVVDEAFEQRLGSAEVTADVLLGLNGVRGLPNPVTVNIKGPYASAKEGRLPRLDWKVRVKAGRRKASGGLVSLGDNAFVTVGGQAYELGTASVGGLSERLGDDGPAILRLQPDRWLSDVKKLGEERVGGVPATHLSGKLDVTKALPDLNEVLKDPLTPILLGRPVRPLSAREMEALRKSATGSVLDVWIGKKDGRVRRLSTQVNLMAPPAERRELRGLEFGTVAVSLELVGVGGNREIAAPADPRPIEELLEGGGLPLIGR